MQHKAVYYSTSSLYMFRVSTTPIIRNTQNCNYSFRYCAATYLQRGQAWPRWREVAAQKIWTVPEAVVTVLCTPDDGCGWYPKHVDWNRRIINRQTCVASRWTIIDVFLFHCTRLHIFIFFIIRLFLTRYSPAHPVTAPESHCNNLIYETKNN